jgi:cytochrome P450
VSPIYMPGRLRTASRPLRTLIESAPYSAKTKFFNERTLIANHPGLVRHVLVDNAQNYRMAAIRQLILRPILRDGLLTAEGETWKRSRKAMAPVFTPRHARGFAEQMLEQSRAFTGPL